MTTQLRTAIAATHQESNPSINPLVHGLIDWLIESFVCWFFAAIDWRSYPVIDASRPELRKGRRSPARHEGFFGRHAVVHVRKA